MNAAIVLMKFIFIYKTSAKTRKYFWNTQSLRNIFWFQMLIRLLHVQYTESKSHKSHKCIGILRRSTKYTYKYTHIIVFGVYNCRWQSIRVLDHFCFDDGIHSRFMHGMNEAKRFGQHVNWVEILQNGLYCLPKWNTKLHLGYIFLTAV